MKMKMEIMKKFDRLYDAIISEQFEDEEKYCKSIVSIDERLKSLSKEKSSSNVNSKITWLKQRKSQLQKAEDDAKAKAGNDKKTAEDAASKKTENDKKPEESSQAQPSQQNAIKATSSGVSKVKVNVKVN